MADQPPGRGSRTPRAPWAGRRVVLGVCGGIAAYKVIQVARDLTLLGAVVDVVLTEAAQNFVAPLTFEGVTGRKPLTGLFSAEGAALHVSLGRDADAICIAPATADFLSRAASGRADDLLTTVLLATHAPVLVAPSMNDRMFAHPQTQANLEHLVKELGYEAVGPVSGMLAVGEGAGPGRMVEAVDLVEAVGRALTGDNALRGRQVLVTAGPTREAVDAVRYVGNRSSGKMGFALARVAWRRGAQVSLVSGPSALAPPFGVSMVRVETAVEMRDAAVSAAKDAEVVIHAAAVSDYRPANPASGKIKRAEQGDALEVSLVMNPGRGDGDQGACPPGRRGGGVCARNRRSARPSQGKAHSEGVRSDRRPTEPEPTGEGFESDTNRVVILGEAGPGVEVPLTSKDEVACRVLDEVEHLLRRSGGP